MRLFEITDRLYPELDKLENEAKSENISIRISHEKKTLYLDHIVRKNDKKGSAKPYMKRLINIADKYKLKIKLYAKGNPEKLINYYKQYGFTVDKNENDEAAMIRLPRKLQ